MVALATLLASCEKPEPVEMGTAETELNHKEFELIQWRVEQPSGQVWELTDYSDSVSFNTYNGTAKVQEWKQDDNDSYRLKNQSNWKFGFENGHLVSMRSGNYEYDVVEYYSDSSQVTIALEGGHNNATEHTIDILLSK